MNIIHNLTLDVATSSIPQTVFAKQGDNNTRTISISLLDKGLSYNIPSDVTARIHVTKPDKKCVLNDAVINSNKIIVELTGQMLAVEGLARAEIGLYKNDDLLTSQVFFIDIKKAALNMEEIESSDEFKSLNQIIENANQAANAANQAAEDILNKLENGEFDGKDGKDGIDGTNGVDGVDGANVYLVAAQSEAEAMTLSTQNPNDIYYVLG